MFATGSNMFQSALAVRKWNSPESTVAETITSSQEARAGASAADKRRSTRVAISIAIVVAGVDTLNEPFREATTTTEVNCYGCRYRSKNYVQKGGNVAIEIPHPELRLPPRLTRGRVIWVQRPRRMREPYEVAVEFEVPGNIWGVASPPKDWFPHPDDVKRAAVEPTIEVMPNPRAVDSGTAVEPPQGTGIPAESIATDTRAVTVEEMTFALGHLGASALSNEKQTLSGVVEGVVDKALVEIREQMMERILGAIAEARAASQLREEELETRLRKALESGMDLTSVPSADGKSTKRRRRSKNKS